jgi:RNA polymerase sigma-70 factor, ECF subfamily
MSGRRGTNREDETHVKPEHDSDETLLEHARAGDRDALEALLSRHQQRVYGFGMKMCRDSEDAKDVLQDTLLAAARNVRDFRGASSISTWLYTIARSFCIKHRRRSKFAPEAEESLDAPSTAKAARELADPTRAADESLAGHQVQAALERAVAALDPMYREVLVLRDMEGLTAPETAEVLGLTVEAVKSRLHRARLAVRAVVAPLLGVAPSATEPAVPAARMCPDVLRLFSEHLEGEISSALCAELEGHVAACPACRAKCDSLQRTLVVCKNAPAPEVPATVQASVRAALRKAVTGLRS